jgi:hypothetical protein
VQGGAHLASLVVVAPADLLHHEERVVRLRALQLLTPRGVLLDPAGELAEPPRLERLPSARRAAPPLLRRVPLLLRRGGLGLLPGLLRVSVRVRLRLRLRLRLRIRVSSSSVLAASISRLACAAGPRRASRRAQSASSFAWPVAS